MNMNRRQFFRVCSAGLGGSSIALMGFSPTAALAEVRTFKLARATETRSTCPYCSVACGLLVYSTGDKSKNSKSTIIHVEGDPDNPVNRGTLCPKGAGVRDMMQSKDRLKWPEVRESGTNEWKRISWHDAIERITKHMKADRDANFVTQNKDGVTVNRWPTFAALAASAAATGHGANSTANAVHIALDNESVEHQVVGASPDLYKQPAVRMLIELARTLAEPDNNASLHHTLVSELFNIPNDLIAPLASKARYEHESLKELLSENNDKELSDAIGLITKLRAEAGALSIGQLLWKAVSESGYKDRIFKKASEDDQAGSLVGDLNQFFKSLKEFEGIAIQPTAGQYLLSLPALMAAGETTDNTLDISEDVVTVTTVHKAKGLEWDTVYIPYLTEASFPMRPQGIGLAVPDDLKVVKDGPADDHYLEERRVLYVAATRARHNLIVSFSDKGRTGTTKKPSRFIDELFGNDASVNTAITEVGEAVDQIVDQIDLPRKVSIPSSILSGETVRLSVSQAQVLLTCPLNFYYKFVLKAPEEPTTSTDYGSQLYTLFEQINVGRRDGNMPDLSTILEDLKLGWNKAGYSSKTQQERAYERARSTVKNFYDQALSDPAPYLIEHPFEVSLPGKIVLHGRIDVVYQTDDGVEIQDYKTGDSVKDDKKAKQKAQSSQQLTMYALAWQKQTGEIPKVSLRFPDTNQFAKVAKQQKSLDTIENNLQKAVDNLRSGKFPAGASQHDYCIHPEIN